MNERFRKYIHSLEDEALWRCYVRVHTTTEQEKLYSIILSTVKHFGIYRCFLSLFEHTLDKQIQPFELDPENELRLLISVVGNHSKIHGDKEPLFPSRNLVPDEYLPREERFSWLVRIIYTEEVKGACFIGKYGEDHDKKQ